MYFFDFLWFVLSVIFFMLELFKPSVLVSNLVFLPGCSVFKIVILPKKVFLSYLNMTVVYKLRKQAGIDIVS